MKRKPCSVVLMSSGRRSAGRAENLADGSAVIEGVVLAEIDLNLAEDKTRPDGTDLFAARRPRHDAWKHFVDAAYWNTELQD